MEGLSSIALLRLVVMAQGSSQKVLDAFAQLQEEDRYVLEVELARTGCAGQRYSKGPDVMAEGGPAFLVYYAPALLQKNCAADAAGSLTVLAEVLRQARILWPAQVASANETVIIQIDVLKGLEVEALMYLQAGEYWALQRVSNKHGQVKKTSLLNSDGSQLQQVDMSAQRVLSFGGHNIVINPEPVTQANSTSPPQSPAFSREMVQVRSLQMTSCTRSRESPDGKPVVLHQPRIPDRPLMATIIDDPGLIRPPDSVFCDEACAPSGGPCGWCQSPRGLRKKPAGR